MRPWREPGFVLFAGVFEGWFVKRAVQNVVFCGEIVVKCVVKRGELMVVF
jgi:DNA-binding transcriptional regulator of glucitol operon